MLVGKAQRAHVVSNGIQHPGNSHMSTYRLICVYCMLSGLCASLRKIFFLFHVWYVHLVIYVCMCLYRMKGYVISFFFFLLSFIVIISNDKYYRISCYYIDILFSITNKQTNDKEKRQKKRKQKIFFLYSPLFLF